MSPLAPCASGRHRIVFLAGTNADWGGASRVLFNTLRASDRTIFAPIVLLSRPGPGVAVLDDLGIAHLIWRLVPELEDGLLNYSSGLVRSLRALRELRAELRDVNFNFWRPAEILAARLLRIPVVTHFHAIAMSPRPLLRFSSAIAAVSNNVAQQAASNGRRIEVIPNTVTLERFDRANSLRPELELDESAVVVSFVGQIREGKGIDSFLRMAHAICDPNVRSLIVGECRDQNYFEGAYDIDRLRRETGGDERIRYLGYRRDVENVFRTSDILVVPSRLGKPLGLINIEGGAVGIPVVTTRGHSRNCPRRRDGPDGQRRRRRSADRRGAAARRIVRTARPNGSPRPGGGRGRIHHRAGAATRAPLPCLIRR